MSQDAGDGSPSPVSGSEDESSNMAEDKNERTSSQDKTPEKGANDNKPATKSNAKDPSRPRRKKARRACFACQRAHLTCGDERPCLRCIKRGLQDQCHDGVRKKAKYLHDAPAEALIPSFPGNYHLNGSHMQTVPGATTAGTNGMSLSHPGHYYAQSTPDSYPQYSPLSQQNQMKPPLMDNANMVGDFTPQPNVGSPTHLHPTSSQQVSPIQDMSAAMDQPSGLGSAGNASFDSSFLEASDPSLFNFNIQDLNFGNHYGALEFGMLGHMSSGAFNTPDVDIVNPMAQPNHGSVSYDGSTGFPTSDYGYNQNFQLWHSVPNSGSRQSSTTNLWALQQNNGMEAFAVGEHNASVSGQSPHSQDYGAGYSSSNTVSPETQFAQPDQLQQPDLLRQSVSHAQRQHRRPAAFPNDVTQAGLRKRRRDTSEIYASVTEPYPYPEGFHGLTALLQRRFPSQKRLRIAKALSNIRPSFISCNQNLSRDDLIFMEKCLQRTLCEYEHFVNAYGTPTIICRRTGEIAAVSKEFSLVTGWRRDVLLGQAPNLNVNNGSGSSGTETGTSSRGAATPRIPNMETDPGRPHPVYLAELLDDDSVVQFYEDFSELAFGASREAIIGAPCSLLKYKTKEDPGWGPEDRLAEDGKRVKKQGEVKNESFIKGEAGMNMLGEKDGKVDAMMCWTVKRDVFDIPMLIVMNFLPNI